MVFQNKDLLDKLSLHMTIILPPLVLLSFSRIFTQGFIPVMAMHLILGLVQVITHFYFKDKYPRLATSFLIFLFFAIGVGAILNNKDVYYGSPFFLIAMLFTSMFFRKHIAIATLLLSIAMGYLLSFLALDSVKHLMIIGPNAIGFIIMNILSELKLKLENTAKKAVTVSEQLENELELKKNFFATMTHELRTPLNGIIGGIDALSFTKLTEKQKDLLDTVGFSNRILLDIVNDILDFSKIGTNQFKIHKEVFSLRELIQNLTESHQTTIKQKNIKFNIDYKFNDEDFVYTDQMRLAQVLNNLISNAIKFTDKGNVTLTINHKQNNGQRNISFEVRDTGVGIKNEYIENIFIPFSQESSETAKVYGGTGLGLAICKELVTLMGGSIEVSSELGKGSCFKFNFVFHENDIKSHTDLKRQDFSNMNNFIEEFKQLNILVAEDNIINTKIIRTHFDRLGIQADFALNGEEVLVKVTEKTYQIIFMDFMMPEMDGLEATRRIRENLDHSNLYIIGCSANLKDGDDVKSLLMDDAIGKPLSKNSIQKALNRYFHSMANEADIAS